MVGWLYRAGSENLQGPPVIMLGELYRAGSENLQGPPVIMLGELIKAQVSGMSICLGPAFPCRGILPISSL